MAASSIILSLVESSPVVSTSNATKVLNPALQISLGLGYSSIGILGLYETLKYFGYTYTDTFDNTYYKPEAYSFGEKIFKVIHNVKDTFLLDMNQPYIATTSTARLRHKAKIQDINFIYFFICISFLKITKKPVHKNCNWLSFQTL